MSQSIKFSIVAIGAGFLALALCLLSVSNVLADAGPSAPPAAAAPSPEAGSASAAGSPSTPAPSDALANPVDDPIEAYSDLKAAKKQGWAFAILAAFVMFCAGIGRAATKWPSWPVLSWINKHKKVLIVTAAVGVTASAAFNALSLGGSWYAAAMTAGGALLAFINAAPNEAKS